MNEIGIDEIMALLPHRYPFLLIDRVKEFDAGKRIVALKNVTINEPYFPGHFPQRPIMPGVLILEAMAQAAGLLVFRSRGGLPSDNTLYYVGIDTARFKRPVVPGDQLEIEVHIERTLRNISKFGCVARVAGETAAEATIMCAMQSAQAK